ncbi:MAG: GNAT family N-acetyltransferase [Sphingobacteriia bacterium]|nr:MAG: GNAT family N-acetyltransferase [Sphingobacteriia bacterium]
MIPGFTLRPIALEDNASMARIIRDALTELGANKPGTVFYDDSTDHLFELFQAQERAAYWVAEKDGMVVGGAGIYPTDGLPATTCELVKMYLSPAVRGLGLGHNMIDHCLQEAKAIGFTQVYLETMPELKQAVKVYEKFGFSYLQGPMGNSGHNGCDIWMLKTL